MKTLAVLVLGLAFLGCSTSSFSQEITIQPQHANGNTLERAFVYHQQDTDMMAFCQLAPVTEATKGIEGALVVCVPMTATTAAALTKFCIGISTQDGPFLECDERTIQRMIQESSI